MPYSVWRRLSIDEKKEYYDQWAKCEHEETEFDRTEVHEHGWQKRARTDPGPIPGVEQQARECQCPKQCASATKMERER